MKTQDQRTPPFRFSAHSCTSNTWLSTVLWEPVMCESGHLESKSKSTVFLESKSKSTPFFYWIQIRIQVFKLRIQIRNQIPLKYAWIRKLNPNLVLDLHITDGNLIWLSRISSCFSNCLSSRPMVHHYCHWASVYMQTSACSSNVSNSNFKFILLQNLNLNDYMNKQRPHGNSVGP